MTISMKFCKENIRKFDQLLFTKADDPIEHIIEFASQQDGFHIATVDTVTDYGIEAWSSNALKGPHKAFYTWEQLKADEVELYRFIFRANITHGALFSLQGYYDSFIYKKFGYDYWAIFSFVKRWLPKFAKNWFQGSKKAMICSEYSVRCWELAQIIKPKKRADEYTPFEVCEEFFSFKFKFKHLEIK